MALFGETDDKKGLFSLESKTTKIIGWTLLGAGVVMGGYALYKGSKKKDKKSGKLSGVGTTKRLKSGKKAKRVSF